MRIQGFDWDEGNWPKCGKHGVPRSEIEFMLTSAPKVLPDPSSATREVRFHAIGLTEAGRHIFVVFTLHNGNPGTRLRPISARYMHRKEIVRYEQR